MQIVGQNIAISAVVLFLMVVFLRRVPILGFFVRMLTRALFLVSPVMIAVLVVGLVWFHGTSLLSGKAEKAVASPVVAPLPIGRPDD